RGGGGGGVAGGALRAKADIIIFFNSIWYFGFIRQKERLEIDHYNGL
ncbi:hypothetical protein HMPREF9542_00914, partial [Escherichia coli MS 117-3]